MPRNMKVKTNEYASILPDAETGRCRQADCSGASNAQRLYLRLVQIRFCTSARRVSQEPRPRPGISIVGAPGRTFPSWKDRAGPTPENAKTWRIEFLQQTERRKNMTFQNIIPAHPFSGLFPALHDLRMRAQEQRTTRAAYTRTLNELSAMSSRELADIGLHRSDIPGVAAEAAIRK